MFNPLSLVNMKRHLGSISHHVPLYDLAEECSLYRSDEASKAQPLYMARSVCVCLTRKDERKGERGGAFFERPIF